MSGMSGPSVHSALRLGFCSPTDSRQFTNGVLRVRNLIW